MKVCFLGTGGSWPTKRRNPLAISVSLNRTHILLDCGEGTQRQMLHSSVSPMKLDAVFITHLHGDHFLGVPGLVQSMSLMDRNKQLDIYGPPGMIRSFKLAMEICHNNPRFLTTVHELHPGAKVKVKDLTVSAQSSNHSIPSLAYRIDEGDRPGKFNRARALELGIPEGKLWGSLQRGEEVRLKTDKGEKIFKPEMVLGPRRPGRSIGYTGDTYPMEEHIEFFRGVNMLIHEATFTEDLHDRAEEFLHSTAKGAALIAKKAGAGKLYLVHTSPRYTKEGTETEALNEARNVFFESYLPEDLESVRISL